MMVTIEWLLLAGVGLVLLAHLWMLYMSIRYRVTKPWGRWARRESLITESSPLPDAGGRIGSIQNDQKDEGFRRGGARDRAEPQAAPDHWQPR